MKHTTMIRSVLTRCRRPVFQGFLSLIDATAAYLALSSVVGGLDLRETAASGTDTPSVFRVILLGALLVAVFAKCGLYEIRRRWDLRYLILATLVGSAAATALFLACCHAAEDTIPRSVFLTLVFRTATVALLVRLASREVVRWCSRRGIGVKRVVVVGDNSVAEAIRRRIEDNPMAGLALVGQAVPSDSVAGPGVTSLIGSMNVVKHEMLLCEPDRVLFAVDIAEHEELQELAEFCLANHIEVLQVPYLHNRYRGQVAARELLGMPFLGLGGHSLDGWEFAVKSILDRVAAVALILALAPLLIALSAAIRIGAGKAVLRRQCRVGKGGVPFMLLDFETRDAGGRRTGLGEFLARNGLHRLPELLNVLRGDMSLVGPEPETTARAGRLDDWQRTRLSVKPGITGLAQIRARSISSGVDRSRHDQEYFDSQGLALDLRILLAWTLAYARRRPRSLVRSRSASVPQPLDRSRTLPHHEVAG